MNGVIIEWSYYFYRLGGERNPPRRPEVRPCHPGRMGGASQNDGAGRMGVASPIDGSDDDDGS